MGLDMYLNKMPRYKYATANDVYAVESYLDWKKAKKDKSPYANCTFYEWCHMDKPSKEHIDFYSKYYEKKYSEWDIEKKYGHMGIIDNVAYWRKQNAIHRWFVDNIQDGEDDCMYHAEVTKNDLRELLSLCQRVLLDNSLANDLLPTQGGFFFGDTTYDEWYLQGIQETVDQIYKIFNTTDFEKEMIYYRSSW